MLSTFIATVIGFIIYFVCSYRNAEKKRIEEAKLSLAEANITYEILKENHSKDPDNNPYPNELESKIKELENLINKKK